MSSTPLLFALVLLAIASACSDPKCPPPYMQFGNVCRLCPPGEDREQGRCVPLRDGAVEAITEEETDVAEEPPEGPESMPDANDTSGEDGGTNEPDAGVGVDSPCYRDEDKDGVGAGEVIDCARSNSSAVSTTNADCDDADPNRSPSLSDVCGDRIDNDCDGTADDESNNACGGRCSIQLGHQPGEACTNGLKGACSRVGTYECSSPSTMACNAPQAFPSTEVCGDGIDNDCDGRADEDDAMDARTWYQDCDNDGYPTALSSTACNKPAATASCGNWLSAMPTTTTEDCWDHSSAYSPGTTASATPHPENPSGDLNCDGSVDYDDWVTWPIPGSLVSNVAYLCSPDLDCGSCWMEACSSRDVWGGCIAVQSLETLRCTSSLRVRTAPNSGCTWSGTGVTVVDAQLECL